MATVSKTHAFYRAAIELVALASVAWIISVLIEPDPRGINVVRFGLKWFVATFFIAAINFVFIPFFAVFVIGSVAIRFSSKHPKYWKMYRIAFVITFIWVLLGNYGAWYADCRQKDSIDECQIGWHIG